ncbi:MAG: hypothetical protein MUF39_02780 [Cyclobacteriaceae bacterium]|nr:hypothetical protein [Cyclobacteriaceae bacterium]
MAHSKFDWSLFIQSFEKSLQQSELSSYMPWQLTIKCPEILSLIILSLGKEYKVENGIAIHVSARIEPNVIMKAPVIIGPDCFIASHAYLRGGVYLIGNNSIGPGCEVKSSFIFPYH